MKPSSVGVGGSVNDVLDGRNPLLAEDRFETVRLLNQNLTPTIIYGSRNPLLAEDRFETKIAGAWFAVPTVGGKSQSPISRG